MYQSKLKNDSLDRLFTALAELQSLEEYYRFFEDICTISELQAIAQRLEVAEMLSREETYTTIANNTGASTATISRVKKCLNYGADGYKIALSRLAQKSDKSTNEQEG